MISEKKLAYYEHVAGKTCSAECRKIITQLVNEVRKLNAEADSLALRVAMHDKCLFVCPIGEKPTLEQCQQCFRAQAREEVSHD